MAKFIIAGEEIIIPLELEYHNLFEREYSKALLPKIYMFQDMYNQQILNIKDFLGKFEQMICDIINWALDYSNDLVKKIIDLGHKEGAIFNYKKNKLSLKEAEKEADNMWVDSANYIVEVINDVSKIYSSNPNPMMLNEVYNNLLNRNGDLFSAITEALSLIFKSRGSMLIDISLFEVADIDYENLINGEVNIHISSIPAYMAKLFISNPYNADYYKLVLHTFSKCYDCEDVFNMAEYFGVELENHV